LAEAGIGGVTISVLDPDLRTRGLGVARLESAGVVVRLGLLAEQGLQQIAGFEKRLRTGLPWVHVGRDDGTFDAVVDSLQAVDLAACLAEAGSKGVMRLCLLSGSAAADQAVALNLVDSSE
jgi:diaminohydroxyphosphoribosylaminopyrimidine deaminase/5-amino-6-(5-phosphoribosylamino)uracil reductase